MHRSRSGVPLSCALLLLACGGREAEPAPRAVPAPPPVATAEPEPEPPPPPPLARGACRVTRTTPAPRIETPLYQAKVSFDERGGMLAYVSRTREVVAATISPEGAIGTPTAVGWSADHLAHVVRIADHYALVLSTACEETRRCTAVGLLDTAGRHAGELRVAPGFREGSDLAPVVEGGALYYAWQAAGSTLALDRFELSEAGTLTQRRLLDVPTLASANERPYPLALAASGQRWALLVTKAERTELYSSERSGPARVALPLARMAGLDSPHLLFVRDRLQLAGRRYPTRNDPPAWLMEVSTEGRVIEPPVRLAADDTFAGDQGRTTVSSDRQLLRTDGFGRPIGEPLQLPPMIFGITAGASEHLLAIRQVAAESYDTLRIECALGAAPAPGPRVPLDGADPAHPCGAVMCSLQAPSMAALLRAVGHKCDGLSFGEREHRADLNPPGHSVTVVGSRRTGNEHFPEVATLTCSRAVNESSTARWAFLAARTGSGWSACTLDGRDESFFDFQLEIGQVRLEQWMEGDPPELIIPVTIDDSSSDGGEVSESRGERLHVCGLESGALACWGSIVTYARTRDGRSENHPHAVVERHRVEPDGHGWVTVTSETPASPGERFEVRRLRPGCPDQLP